MITSGTWFLFFHVLAALWLAGGAFGGAVVRARTRRATGPAERAFGLALLWRMTAVFTLPGLLVAGLLGIHLVGARGYAFGDRWVWISMLIWLLMLALAVAWLAPHRKRAASQAAAASSAGTAVAVSKLAGIFEDLIALGVVVLTLLMVLKPA